MTSADLLKLLDRRNNAWRDMGHHQHPLNTLSAEDRQEVEEKTRQYHAAERSIVEHLREQDRPIHVAAMILHLTADRQHFIELDAKTREPVYLTDKSGWKCLLYEYPTNGAAH